MSLFSHVQRCAATKDNSTVVEELAKASLQLKTDFNIWKSALSPQDVSKICDNNFWTYVLLAWASISTQSLTTKENIYDETLWYNSRIQIQNTPIIWEHWLKKGTVKIGDLLNENDDFLSRQQIIVQFNAKLPFTELLGLVQAILHCLKNDDLNDETTTDWYGIINKCKSALKLICEKLIYNSELLSESVKKVEKKSIQIATTSRNRV